VRSTDVERYLADLAGEEQKQQRLVSPSTRPRGWEAAVM
jgi:hypothetical protein